MFLHVKSRGSGSRHTDVLRAKPPRSYIYVPADGSRRAYVPDRPLVRIDDRRCPHVPFRLLHRYLHGLDSWRCRGPKGQEEEDSRNAKEHYRCKSEAVSAREGGWLVVVVGGDREQREGWAPSLNT